MIISHPQSGIETNECRLLINLLSPFVNSWDSSLGMTPSPVVGHPTLMNKITSSQAHLPDDSRFCQVDNTIKTPKKWKHACGVGVSACSFPGHCHKMRELLLGPNPPRLNITSLVDVKCYYYYYANYQKRESFLMLFYVFETSWS